MSICLLVFSEGFRESTCFWSKPTCNFLSFFHKNTECTVFSFKDPFSIISHGLILASNWALYFYISTNTNNHATLSPFLRKVDIFLFFSTSKFPLFPNNYHYDQVVSLVLSNHRYMVPNLCWCYLLYKSVEKCSSMLCLVLSNFINLITCSRDWLWKNWV